MSTPWLNRRLIELPYYFRLCITERDFNTELKRMKTDSVPFLSSPYADATCHFLSCADGTNCVIVCLTENRKKRSVVEIYGLLVHEAVHIWQGACELIGENNPGDEIEAYAVQSIAQELIASYNQQAKVKFSK